MTAMTRTDVADVATHLRAVLASVRAGELVAPETYRARLEGAVLALDLMAGVDVQTSRAILTDPCTVATCN